MASIINEEERQKVLAEIGFYTIRQAVSKEGLLISNCDTLTVNWRAAEVWAKKKAHECSVSEDVLRHIIINHLKEILKAESDKKE